MYPRSIKKKSTKRKKLIMDVAKYIQEFTKTLTFQSKVVTALLGDPPSECFNSTEFGSTPCILVQIRAESPALQ